MFISSDVCLYVFFGLHCRERGCGDGVPEMRFRHPTMLRMNERERSAAALLHGKESACAATTVCRLTDLY
jgi:hypothetical protein